MLSRFSTVNKKIFFLFFLVLFAINFAYAQEQKFAEIGDFRLESGETIKNCKIGYRTFGAMNADKSNIVVYLTWAGGNTSMLNFKPTDEGKLIDTNKYFVVAIDALSNGVSSSPSNSKLQPRMKFPRYTMRDLVNSQHEFLTKILKINHVRAVTGVSMGGMQTFQWMVSYPDFMDRAIPIVGSPQPAPYDLIHWQMQIDQTKNSLGWKNGNYAKNPARVFEYEIGAILLTTPDYVNRTMSREKVFEEIKKAATETKGGMDSNDKIRQTEAMLTLDVTEKFGGSWEKTAASVKAKSLVIVSKYDHTVTPAPALKFAELLKSETIVADGDCGHFIHLCTSVNINKSIADFLEK